MVFLEGVPNLICLFALDNERGYILGVILEAQREIIKDLCALEVEWTIAIE